MASLCEDCDGCCRVFEVKEVSKPFGTPCRHLGPTLFGPGCTIYADRPDACKHYVCLWLDGQRRGGDFRLDPRLRPDRSKVVIGWPWGIERETIHVYPYPGFADNWKKEPVRGYIQMVLDRGGKVVIYESSEKVIAMRGDMALVGSEDEFAKILADV